MNTSLWRKGPGDCGHSGLTSHLYLNTRSDRGLTRGEKYLKDTESKNAWPLRMDVKGANMTSPDHQPMDDLESHDLVMIFMVEIILTLPGR